jgi:hypothetical protein
MKVVLFTALSNLDLENVEVPFAKFITSSLAMALIEVGEVQVDTVESNLHEE